MREIKFRGKPVDIPNHIWIYGGISLDYDSKFSWIETKDGTCLVEWESVGQYTGLKDKNGKEIYEGDIVKYQKVNYTDCSCEEIESFGIWFVGEIYYAEGIWLGIKNEEMGKLFLPGQDENELEVIGNIYENPELLESGIYDERVGFVSYKEIEDAVEDAFKK